MSLEKDKETHPSYGIVQISRVSGGSSNFYGTSMNPNHFIELSLANSTKVDDKLTGKEHYYRDGEIVRFRMTSVQFAELITNLNHGEGIPCTLVQMNGMRIEDPPVQKNLISQAIENSDCIQESHLSMKQDIESLVEIVNKKGSQKEKDFANGLVKGFMERIVDSVNFQKKMIVEAGDKVVSQAKVEIEAALIGKIQNVGLQSLSANKDEPLQLDAGI